MNDFIELLPYVIVVKNGIKNHTEILNETLKRNFREPWNDAYDHSLPGSDASIFDESNSGDGELQGSKTLFGLYENLRELFVGYIDHFNLRHLLVEPLYTGNYSMKEYPTGASLGIHRDYGAFSKFNQEIPCSITINAYLNDDYHGGELVIYDSTLPFDHPSTDESLVPLTAYKPAAGDAIIFPSIMLHSVNKVTSGTRYGLNIRLKESAQPTWFNFLAGI